MTTLKLIVGPVQLAWEDDAACKGALSIFFPEEIPYPEKTAAIATAKRICASCPAREECLEHAIVENETTGIWGGLTAGERRRLISARARGVA